MDPKEDSKLDSNGGSDGGFIGDDLSSELQDEDDGAPVLPETIAASFEFETKPQLAGDNIDAQIPGEQTAALSFQGHGDEEGGLEDAEDDEQAPAPPEMIAASYESIDKSDWEKVWTPPKSIEDDIERGIVNSVQDLDDLLREVFDMDRV
jgi:hypothetical protein